MGYISISGLGKAFRQYASPGGRLLEWASFERLQRHTKKWVFQDFSLEVRPGESVGVIGINGAGKSTLLKMITGTLQPSEGSIKASGRLVALLELGMGFHPDFTGRQNVFMAGQI